MTRRWVATLLTFLIPAAIFVGVVFGYWLLFGAPWWLGDVLVTLWLMVATVTLTAGLYAIGKAVMDRLRP